MPIWKNRYKEQVEHCRKISKIANDKTTHEQRVLWGKEGGKKNIKLMVQRNPNFCSDAGKRSRFYENKFIESIKNDFDLLFFPTEVCDRIAIKDGKIYFIEVKRKREKLRKKQQQFKDFAKENYLIFFT